MKTALFALPCILLVASCSVPKQQVDAGWAVNPEVLRDQSIPELERLACTAEPGLRSSKGDTQSLVRFTNHSKTSVALFWLDYDGKRKFYVSIPAGEVQDMQTYLTHPWVIADAAGNCLEIRMPAAGRYRVVIQ